MTAELIISAHGQLGGLLNDDHTIYALLAGRSGGQVLHGGTGASENLDLHSTANATKGLINAHDRLILAPNITAPVADNIRYAPGATFATGAGAVVNNVIYALADYDVQTVVFIHSMIYGGGTFNQQAGQLFSAFLFMQATPVLQSSNTLYPPLTSGIFYSAPTVKITGAGGDCGTTPFIWNYAAIPNVWCTGALDEITVTDVIGFRFNPQYRAQNATSVVNIVNVIGLEVNELAQSQTSPGTENITNYFGVKIAVLNFATNNFGMHAAIPVAANNWFLYNAGGAQNWLAGDNAKTFFGDALDAELYWNGSHFVIDPDPVTVTGQVYIGASADDVLACGLIQLGPSPATEYFTSTAGYLQMWFDSAWEVYITGGTMLFEFTQHGGGGAKLNMISESYIACNTFDQIFLDDNPDGVTILNRFINRPSADTAITAAGGITVNRGIMRIYGSGGAIDITADPQIVAGVDGQVAIIQGTDDTNTVKLDNGAGLALSASITLAQNDNITLFYDSGESLWIETSRTTVA